MSSNATRYIVKIVKCFLCLIGTKGVTYIKRETKADVHLLCLLNDLDGMRNFELKFQRIDMKTANLVYSLYRPTSLSRSQGNGKATSKFPKFEILTCDRDLCTISLCFIGLHTYCGSL